METAEALREHPELVRKYLGSVVPITDNYFATLNSAVFSDGSFVYVPPGPFISGGDPEAFERAKPILDALNRWKVDG